MLKQKSKIFSVILKKDLFITKRGPLTTKLYVINPLSHWLVCSSFSKTKVMRKSLMNPNVGHLSGLSFMTVVSVWPTINYPYTKVDYSPGACKSHLKGIASCSDWCQIGPNLREIFLFFRNDKKTSIQVLSGTFLETLTIEKNVVLRQIQ